MKRFLVPALVALAGMVSLAFLFPRFDPSRSLHAALDRNQAVAKAKQLASKYGIDTRGWQTAATTLVDAPAGPVKIEVALIAPGGQQYVQAAWYPDGRLASWRPHNLPATAGSPVEVPAPPAAPKAKGYPGVHYTFGGTGERVSIDTPDSAAALRQPVYLPMRLIPAFWYLAVLVYFPVAAFRHRMHYRVALMLMAAQIVWAAVSFWGSTNYQTLVIQQLSDPGKNAMSLVMSEISPAKGWAFFWLFLFAAVGFSIRTAGTREKWSSLELLAQGGFFKRAVGWPVAAGLLSGVGIAAIPYLVAATGLFRGSPLIFRSVEALAAPSPNAAAWALSAGVLALGLFGFAYPLAAKLRNPVLRWALFAPVGIAIVGGFAPPFSAPAPNLVTAVFLFLAYALLYLRADLLATITAMMAAQAVLVPCVLLAQPGGSIRALAVPVVLVGLVALAVSMRSAIRGREDSGEIPDVPSLADQAAETNTESGRVRLQAEFEVARKAQQDALPASSPIVEGYSLSGSCEPAQQVGGDLYDYFPLADGRLGIAVADVSGKGVPAALYMMVTKGLLAATTRDSSDLAYILEQTNLHLYRACKKKVFVTLAMVALDPARRRLQHGRAGHNPILWRRPARGETVLLKPPGLGLGMTPGERFNSSLKIEELELEPGDAIVLYSDGVTEAVDSTMEQFGEGRLIRSVEQTDGQPAEESRAAILRDLAEFVGTTPARDDVTLVVLRVAEFVLHSELI